VNNRILAILAAIGASTIYGINHTLAKDVMPTYVQPYGFILLRVVGAAILFWSLSFLKTSQKIKKEDWPRLIACAICGMVINMLFFFKGLSLSTPINSSVIITLSPVMVLLLGAIILREKITLLKIAGIIVGLIGALILVFFSSSTSTNAPNIPLGNILFIVNAFSFALYLILVKPLTAKYDAITLMKWLFLIATIINLPITIGEFNEIVWQEIPTIVLWQIAFVVVATTFMTYLLNIFAIKHLSASTLSVFMYLQPLVAIIYATSVGADQLNLVKIVAGLFVFTGVYMVTKKKTVTTN